MSPVSLKSGGATLREDKEITDALGSIRKDCDSPASYKIISGVDKDSHNESVRKPIWIVNKKP